MKNSSLFLLSCILFMSGTGCDSTPAEPASSYTAASPYVPHMPEPPSSRWTIEKTVSPLDNRPKISVSNAELVIRCSPKPEGYVNPPLHNLGGQLQTSGDRDQRVRYKIDGGTLKTGVWDVSTSFDSLFIPPATLRQVAHGQKQLMYEYQPDYVVAETTTIDLSGLQDALKSAGCKF